MREISAFKHPRPSVLILNHREMTRVRPCDESLRVYSETHLNAVKFYVHTPYRHHQSAI